MFYDPMIAKLITWAPTREAAIDAPDRGARRVPDRGIGHNIDFLSALMQHPRFREGALTTGFIAEEYPDGFHGAPASDELMAQLAAIAARGRPRARRPRARTSPASSAASAPPMAARGRDDRRPALRHHGSIAGRG